MRPLRKQNQLGIQVIAKKFIVIIIIIIITTTSSFKLMAWQKWCLTVKKIQEFEKYET